MVQPITRVPKLSRAGDYPVGPGNPPPYLNIRIGRGRMTVYDVDLCHFMSYERHKSMEGHRFNVMYIEFTSNISKDRDIPIVLVQAC